MSRTYVVPLLGFRHTTLVCPERNMELLKTDVTSRQNPCDPLKEVGKQGDKRVDILPLYMMGYPNNFNLLHSHHFSLEV